MQGKRTDRVGHLIQMELGNLILHRMKDPRLGFVTITHVDVAPDLRSARVFYSVMGDAKTKKSTHDALEKAAGFLQAELGHAIQLRNTPKLTFLVDDSIDRSIEIDQVIREIHLKDSEGASA
jgi:ribosome-binding factor A